MGGQTTFGRFSAGDALRGLSALGVMALHYTQFGLGGAGVVFTDVTVAMKGTYGPVGFLAIFGGLWLTVFFVLSGYLISRPFVTSYIRDEPRPGIRRYARNRILRIVPAFWVAVFATLVVFGLVGSPLWVVPLTLGFGQVLAPEEPFISHIAQGWTLGAEMAFYVLVPAVALAAGGSPGGNPRGRALRLLALCFAMLAGTMAWRLLGPTEDLTWIWLFPGVAAFFVPGIVLAVIEAAWFEKVASLRSRRLAAPIALAGLALFLALATTNGDPEVLILLLQAAGAGLIVAGALLREWSGAPPWRVLRNRATDWLGQRSYSVYVLHYGVGLWLASRLAVKGHPWDTLVTFGSVAVLATFVLSDLSWRWVERPFLRRKRRQAEPPTALAEPALAPASSK
jgi:peptidoglycan/LPS O-acetylase OafA/YrhL